MMEDDVPRDRVVDIVVAVDQVVPEAGNLVVVCNALGKFRCGLAESDHGFADDLELALDGGAEVVVGEEVVVRALID
jgi:hypothetical protein